MTGGKFCYKVGILVLGGCTLSGVLFCCISCAVMLAATGRDKPKPPPVPPRPNKTVIAEAMARNRRTGQHVHAAAAAKQTRVVVNGHGHLHGGGQTPAAAWATMSTSTDNTLRITIPDTGPNSAYRRAITMASLQGLPPLPKSLSGVNLLENSNLPEQLRLQHAPHTPPPPPPPHTQPHESTKRIPPPPPPRKLTTLDTQLAILRKEMYSLRELDLSLLSQLWSLNESIQEFRQLQEALSPPSPSSDLEDDVLYSNMATLPEHNLSSSSSRSSSADYPLRDV